VTIEFDRCAMVLGDRHLDLPRQDGRPQGLEVCGHNGRLGRQPVRGCVPSL